MNSRASSRHLLLISHFFPPMGGGGVQRATKFVKYLDRYGWHTTIVTGRPEDYWVRDESLLQDLPASARVVRTAAASGLSLLKRFRSNETGGRRSARGFNILRRAGAWLLVPDTYIGWRPFALRAARNVILDDPPHALMSTGPPETNHLVALDLKRETGLPWLADFRDPWFALHLLPAPTALHRAWNSRLEQSVLTAADRIVTTTDSLQEVLQQRTPDAKSKLYVIRNGYDPEDFPPSGGEEPPRAPTRLDSEERAAPLRLVHAGMLAFTRSSAPLLYGLQKLLGSTPERRDQIEIELLGARESSTDELVRRLGLEDCVRLRGYAPHAVAIESMLAADALVLIKHTSERYRPLVPAKLYEYLGACRPILALVPDGEAADLMRTLGCAEIVPPGDPAAVAAALARFLERKQEGSLQQAYSCRRTPQFERPEQARRLADLLEEMVAPPRQPSGEKRQ